MFASLGMFVIPLWIPLLGDIVIAFTAIMPGKHLLVRQQSMPWEHMLYCTLDCTFGGVDTHETDPPSSFPPKVHPRPCYTIPRCNVCTAVGLAGIWLAYGLFAAFPNIIFMMLMCVLLGGGVFFLAEWLSLVGTHVAAAGLRNQTGTVCLLLPTALHHHCQWQTAQAVCSSLCSPACPVLRLDCHTVCAWICGHHNLCNQLIKSCVPALPCSLWGCCQCSQRCSLSGPARLCAWPQRLGWSLWWSQRCCLSHLWLPPLCVHLCFLSTAWMR